MRRLAANPPPRGIGWNLTEQQIDEIRHEMSREDPPEDTYPVIDENKL